MRLGTIRAGLRRDVRGRGRAEVAALLAGLVGRLGRPRHVRTPWLFDHPVDPCNGSACGTDLKSL